MAFKHYQQIRDQEFRSMEIVIVNTFLKNFLISKDSEKPNTRGIFSLQGGESLEYTFTYHEMKLIVDESFIMEDESGQKVTSKPGDLFFRKRLCHHFLNAKLWNWLLLWTTGKRQSLSRIRMKAWRKPYFAKPSKRL